MIIPGLLRDVLQNFIAFWDGDSNTGNRFCGVKDGVQTIAMVNATVTLVMGKPAAGQAALKSRVLKVTPGGTGNPKLKLPPVADLKGISVKLLNASGSAHSFAVRDSGDTTTIVTVEQNRTVEVTSDGTNYRVALTPLGAASTAASTAITGAQEADTAFDTTYTIPANTLKAGSRIRIRAQGIHTATTGTETHTMALKIGSTVIASKAAIDPSNNDLFYFDAVVVVRTAGGAGTMVGTGVQAHGLAGTAAASPFLLASTALDTTAAQIVSVSIDRQAAATDGDSARLDILDVQILD